MYSPPLRPTLRSALSSPSTTPGGSHAALPDSAHVQFPDNPATTDRALPRPSGSRNSSFTKTRTLSGDYGGASKDGYQPRVGFDTFDDNSDDALFSYTLQTASAGYVRTRDTRVFLVAVSPDESGTEALDWLMENLLEDGDEVVALRVLDWEGAERASHAKQEELREEAKQLQQLILDKNDEVDHRKISIIVDFVAGKITDSIMRLIALHRPDSLIVGTRGSRSKLATFGTFVGVSMGSVSRYCIMHSAVPCIVVRPESKVNKSLAKRDHPKRKMYTELVGGTALVRSRSAEAGR